jgi:TIR domain
MKIFLSYCQQNQEQADSLYNDLSEKHRLTITRDIVDLQTFDSLSRFMESVREHDYVIHLISNEYLKSKACMKELLHFMKDDTQKAHYINRTLPIICKPSDSNQPSIFKDDGQLAVIEYWLEQLKTLENNINRVETTHPNQTRAIQNQRKELYIIRDIAENIGDYLSLLVNHINVARLETLRERDYLELLNKVRANTKTPEPQPSDHWQALDEAIAGQGYFILRK